MNCINAYIVLVSIGLCISAENSDPLTSIQIQEKIKTTTDTLTSIDKLLLDLEARRESLQQMKESFSQERADIYPTSCLSTYNQNRSSLMVQVPGHSAFQVACDTSQLAGLGWLVIQRRKSGKVNFYRDWSEYKSGFGYEEDDYFIGLEKLHWLTAYQPFELYIYLEEFYNIKSFAKYDEFIIGDESEKFALKVLGQYSGTAGDSLSYHKGQAFSTYDQDNDKSGNTNCAQFHVGAWWYNNCAESNLNGQHVDIFGKLPEDKARLITWNSFNTSSHFSFVQMMIRPKFGCF